MEAIDHLSRPGDDTTRGWVEVLRAVRLIEADGAVLGGAFKVRVRFRVRVRVRIRVRVRGLEASAPPAGAVCRRRVPGRYRWRK